MKINQDFCFDVDRATTISMTQKALKAYADNFSFADSLDEKFPIFLDTNVLLEYYTISFSERRQFKQFLLKNIDRIYLTNQIESEFLKHRIDRINSYQKSLDSFLNDFQKIKETVETLKEGKINQFTQYINSNKILTNDYENIKKDLHELYDQISTGLKGVFAQSGLFENILSKEIEITEVKKKLEGEADIERNDDLLEIIADLKVTEKLDEDELHFLREKFSTLKPEYDKIKSDQSAKIKKAFPGCGEAENYKAGDFIIYHEIIKFMKLQQTDAIFLTGDITKNDWLLKNKNSLVPFTHYIINHFASTEKILYIFPAKDKIRISYDNVYSERSEIQEELFQNDLQDSNEELNSEQSDLSTQTDVNNNENIHSVSELILSKIDLSNYGNQNRYKKISEDEFLSELHKSEYWATNYGDGFVGVDYFIKKILGYSKGFDIKTSFDIKDSLLLKDKIQIWTYEPEDKTYHDVEALKTK